MTAAPLPSPGADPFQGVSLPMVFISLGVKLPTGEHDAFDLDKYAFDRSKAITGEYSDSDGILPTRFQLGTGTTDLLAGLVWQQRFWRITTTGSLTCLISGGANSVGYERGSKLSWSAGGRVSIFKSGPDFELSGRLGLSGIAALSKDVDHSENTTLLLRQERGPVDGTTKSFTFIDAGFSVDFLEIFNAGLVARFPVTAVSGSDEDSFVVQIGFSFCVRL